MVISLICYFWWWWWCCFQSWMSWIWISAPKHNSSLTLSKSICLSFNVYISNIKVTVILFTQDCCKNLMREYMWKGPARYIFSMNNVTIIVAYNDNTCCYKSLKCKRQMCWSLAIKKGEAEETLSHSLTGLRKWKSLVTKALKTAESVGAPGAFHGRRATWMLNSQKACWVPWASAVPLESI